MTKDYFKFLSDKGESVKLVVLVGPNRVGKSMLIDRLMQNIKIDLPKTRKVVLDKAIVLRIKELEAENRLLKMEIADLLHKNNKLEKVAQRKKEDYFNEL